MLFGGENGETLNKNSRLLNGCLKQFSASVLTENESIYTLENKTNFIQMHCFCSFLNTFWRPQSENISRGCTYEGTRFYEGGGGGLKTIQSYTGAYSRGVLY